MKFVPPSFPPSEHTLTHVRSLRAAGVAAGIKASGAPDVALVVADRAMAAAGLFTQNLLAAPPVSVARRHLAATSGRARAVVVNSGNANACTGEQGERDALETCELVASALGCAREEVLPCSTGVIGVPLPMEKVRAGVASALSSLSSEPEAGRRFLAAIQTTDAFAKEASRALDGGVVAGVCKGAGMIQPDMATMLAFVATDLSGAPEALAGCIRRVADRSFHAVHVDTHTSTNDTFLLLSTEEHAPPGGDALEQALGDVSERLAWLIARDGEGATKVTRVEVTGAKTDEDARAIARLVASSALVRTALFGNDPNWGRFTSQVGNARAHVGDISRLSCTLQGVRVFGGGGPAPFDKAALSRAMAEDDVRLALALADGAGSAFVLTSDLGYRYVEVNAEYTT